MAANTTFLEACTLGARAESQRVINYLEEKYPGHSFTVLKYETGVFPGAYSTKKLTCRAIDEDFVFTTLIDVGTDEIIDEYARAHASKQMGDYLREEFEKRGVRAIVYAGLRASSRDIDYTRLEDISDARLQAIIPYIMEDGITSLHVSLLVARNAIVSKDFGEVFEAVFMGLNAKTDLDVAMGVYVASDSFLDEMTITLADIPITDAGYWFSDREYESQYSSHFTYQINDGKPSLSSAEVSSYVQRGYRYERTY